MARAETTLVSYNFDYDVLDSGPDTYQIFRHKTAKAEIATSFASGGYASAHLTDAAGDGDFVEFQGYFPEQQTGVVHFRFKLLIANQDNHFNVALVGKERYTLSPLGINLWLIYQDGWLRHMSDSIPKKLFQPALYEWYAIDATLNLDIGVYSLRVTREAGDTAVYIENQPFAAGAGGQYSLTEYSFVGDLDDKTATDFYFDDLSITASSGAEVPPLVAPGRRKYFFEMWDDYHRQLQGRLRCLPAKDLQDFGIYNVEAGSQFRNNELDILHRLTRTTPQIGDPRDWQFSPMLSSIVDWLKACDALDDDDAEKARTHIADALKKNPSAYIFQLTSLIIDAKANREDASLYSRALSLSQTLPQHGNDARNMIALALIAFHARRHADIRHETGVDAALMHFGRIDDQELKQLEELGIRALSRDYIGQLQRYMPESWEQLMSRMVLLEQQYYAYLWQENYQAAYSLAGRVSQTLLLRGIAPGVWRERQAEGAFLNREIETALDLYNSLTPIDFGSQLKMADMYHMLGDLASEKALRETIYRNFTRQ